MSRAHLAQRQPASPKRRAMKLSSGGVVGVGGRVGQFWTPGWLAARFAEWVGIRRGTRVLDAGAGMGALSVAALAAGARVTAVEVDERMIARLGPLLSGAAVVHRDFLASLDPRQLEIATPPAFDVVISNPPWEGDLPERFILRAFTFAPRVCVIVPINVLSGVSRAKLWRHVAVRRAKFLPRRPNFGGPGGGMRDVVLLELVRRAVDRTPGDVDHATIEVGE